MFWLIAERSLLHEIFEVLLKDCWGPHKGCFGAARGSRDRGWELLLIAEGKCYESAINVLALFKIRTTKRCWIRN